MTGPLPSGSDLSGSVDGSARTAGWIGLGRMGQALAGRLAEGQFDLRVYNRTRAKAEEWNSGTAVVVDNPVDLDDRDVVFVCVSSSDDLLAVLTGPHGLLTRDPGQPGAQVGARSGDDRGVIVDCSTISPEASAVARQAAADHGWEFLASPISGNPDVVRSGAACFVTSGPRQAFDSVEPLLTMMARAAVYAGEGEAARVAKLGHNLLLGITMQALAETTTLVEGSGMTPESYFEFLAQTVLHSTFIGVKSRQVIERRYLPATFSSTLMLKDLDLGLAQAHQVGVPMPVSSSLRELVQGAINLGYADEDFAALYELQTKLSANRDGSQ